MFCLQVEESDDPLGLINGVNTNSSSIIVPMKVIDTYVSVLHPLTIYRHDRHPQNDEGDEVRLTRMETRPKLPTLQNVEGKGKNEKKILLTDPITLRPPRKENLTPKEKRRE
jgi:hypothetical protein